MSRGYVIHATPCYRRGGFSISGVDFGCFSTVYGDCEALEKREEQTDLHAFIVCVSEINKKGESRKAISE